MLKPPARTVGRPLFEAGSESLAGCLRDQVKMRTTKWSRLSLLIQFLCGFLDYFYYEDEEVVLKGFRDPKKEIVYLTYIGEKKK